MYGFMCCIRFYMHPCCAINCESLNRCSRNEQFKPFGPIEKILSLRGCSIATVSSLIPSKSNTWVRTAQRGAQNLIKSGLSFSKHIQFLPTKCMKKVGIVLQED